MDRKRTKKRYRDAVDICETIAVITTRSRLSEIEQQLVADISINRRRLELADQSGNCSAYAVLLRRHRNLLGTLRVQVDNIQSLCCETEANISRATPGEIYCELEALEREFDDVTFCRKEKLLSVTTEPIELQDINLGPFRIVLDCKTLFHSDSFAYRVIAEDANPAQSDDSVTHPHVQSEIVCEGEAKQPICSALKQLRVFDFFQIISSLLQTYNSGSPYVALEDWHGIRCSDCGDSANREHIYVCESCSANCCEGCSYGCTFCDDSSCSACITSCGQCSQAICKFCLKACVDCDDMCCPDCLDEKERCDECDKKKNEEVEAEDGVDEEVVPAVGGGAPQAADAAVHPDGLGQTVVPA